MEKKVLYINPLAEARERFLFRKINYNSNADRPLKISGGVIMLCTSGTAVLRADTSSYDICSGCEAVLFDKTIAVENCSSDFSLSFFLFSWEIKEQATRKFSSEFWGHLISNPVYRHPEGCLENTLCYFRLIEDIQADVRNKYRNVIAANLLRSMMLNIYDKILKDISSPEDGEHTRKEELLRRFMNLLCEHGRKHRDVVFYADRLCITPRYLSQITNEVLGESPKQTIDGFAIQEIKMLLTFSEMSLQQIADGMCFPDQSYFGRYFRHRTGMSPSEYRRHVIEM